MPEQQQPAGAYGGGPAIPPKKLTIPEIVAMKRDAKRITMMTAYDVAFARLVDEAGIDVTLVGDSLGMVMLGYPTTVPVTMDDMVRHAAAVSRGTKHALLVGDMPFGSYQSGRDDAHLVPSPEELPPERHHASLDPAFVGEEERVHDADAHAFVWRRGDKTLVRPRPAGDDV